MKNFKHLLVAVLCLALVFAFMFSMSSCNRDNEDDVDATPGDTTGDNTGDNNGGDNNPDNTPENPENPEDPDTPDNPNTPHVHSYTGAVVKFPMGGQDGEKVYTCSCGDIYTEKMSAASVTLPSIADMIAAIIGENEYSAELSENATLIRIKDVTDYEEETGYMQFFAIKVGEISVSGKGAALTAALSLDVGFENVNITSPSDVATPSEFETVYTLNVYVNGDEVYFETVQNGEADSDEIENVSVLLYTYLAESMGMTYDQFRELYFVATQAGDYLPLISGLINAIASVEIPEANTGVLDVLALIGEGLVAVETDTNGTTYTLDVQHLGDLLATVEDKTVAEILDAQYGDGTADAIADFINGLPVMTVKQVAEKAIAFSESCGVPIESVYALINYVVYTATEVEFDIASEIETRYNYTLALLLAELQGVEDKAEFEAEMIASVSEMVGTYMGYTFDELYNAYYYGDPDHDFSITDNLHALVDALEGYASCELKLDAEGNLVSLAATLDDESLNVTVNGDTVNVVYKEGSYELLNAALTLDANGALIDAVVTVNDIEYNYVEVTDENGDPIYDEYGDPVIDVVETLENAFVLTYTDNLDGTGSITIDTEYELATIALTTTETDSATTLEATLTVTDKESDTVVFEGSATCVTTVNGSTVSVLLTDGEQIVTIDAETSANGQSFIVTNNGDVMFKYVVSTAVNAEGMEELTGFELIIADYVYEAKKVNGVYEYENDVYYEMLHVSYVKNGDGSASASLVTKDSYKIGTDFYDEETGEWIGWEDTAVIEENTNISVNYDGVSTTVLSVNGYEIIFTYEALPSGDKLEAEFEVDGETYTVSATVTDTGAALLIKDTANTLLDLTVASTDTGATLDFTVNVYVTDGEWDENDEWVVTSKELYNILVVDYDKVNGNVTLTVDYDDEYSVLELEYTNVGGEVTLDVYRKDGDLVLIDGVISTEKTSGVNSESFTISVAIDDYFNYSYEECKDEDGNHNEPFCYYEVVCDADGNEIGFVEDVDFDTLEDGWYIEYVYVYEHECNYYEVIYSMALNGSITFTHSW